MSLPYITMLKQSLLYQNSVGTLKQEGKWKFGSQHIQNHPVLTDNWTKITRLVMKILDSIHFLKFDQREFEKNNKLFFVGQKTFQHPWWLSNCLPIYLSFSRISTRWNVLEDRKENTFLLVVFFIVIIFKMSWLLLVLRDSMKLNPI